MKGRGEGGGEGENLTTKEEGWASWKTYEGEVKGGLKR